MIYLIAIYCMALIFRVETLFIKIKKMARTLEEIEVHLDGISADIDSLMLTVQELKDVIASNPIPDAVQAKIDELAAKAEAIDAKFPAA